MNLDVYIFSCILKEYDEDFDSLSHQDQYDSVTKLYRQFQNSIHYKNKTNLDQAIIDYLEEKHSYKNISNDDLDLDLDLDLEDY